LKLPQVVHAAYASGLQLRAGQRGQKQRGKNRGDRNDNKQLDQGEAIPDVYPNRPTASIRFPLPHRLMFMPVKIPLFKELFFDSILLAVSPGCSHPLPWQGGRVVR
jgi:hypothetical protein